MDGRVNPHSAPIFSWSITFFRGYTSTCGIKASLPLVYRTSIYSAEVVLLTCSFTYFGIISLHIFIARWSDLSAFVSRNLDQTTNSHFLCWSLLTVLKMSVGFLIKKLWYLFKKALNYAYLTNSMREFIFESWPSLCLIEIVLFFVCWNNSTRLNNPFVQSLQVLMPPSFSKTKLYFCMFIG